MRTTTPPDTASTRHARVDWSAVADGQWHLAEAGTDYEVPARFAQAGNKWATRHGYRWSQSIGPEGVKFRIWRAEEAKAA